MTNAIVLRTPDCVPPFMEGAEIARVSELAQSRRQNERRPSFRDGKENAAA